MMFSLKNACVHFLSLMYTTVNALRVIRQIFGIQKLGNANGVLRHLFTKRRAADAYAHQILLSYFKIIAYPVMRPNIGTTRLKNANIVQTLLNITA